MLCAAPEQAYGVAPTYTASGAALPGLAARAPVGLAMAGQLVDTYGNADGSDADKWSAVSKWVVRTEGAVPGGQVFTSTEWTQSCCLVSVRVCVCAR